jgi:cobaltochelatase CobT
VIEKIRQWIFPRPQRPVGPTPYGIFTREYDRIVSADQLDEVLGPCSHEAELAEAWETYSKGLVAWRTRAQLYALEASERIRDSVDAANLADTTISILVDQSGSMRGQNMILAAASTDIASEFLLHLGATVEILGFTTSSWRGGHSRRKWNFSGRPSLPGRLCDLLHIVYRSADDTRSSTEGPHLKPMLRPDLPKENVDGEALEWAASRLRARPESRKLLLVISDGAPVDDSTLHSNQPRILHDHLTEVVHALETSGDIRVAALGINYDVSKYYSNACTVRTPHDLGIAVMEQLERLLVERT